MNLGVYAHKLPQKAATEGEGFIGGHPKPLVNKKVELQYYQWLPEGQWNRV